MDSEAGATGTATITFTITRDTAGTITAATADFSVTLANFPAGSVARLAHIHTAAAGVTGPALVDTGLSPSAAVAMPNGTGSFSFTGVAISPENATAVLLNPAGYYFNVHSVLNPLHGSFPWRCWPTRSAGARARSSRGAYFAVNTSSRPICSRVNPHPGGRARGAFRRPGRNSL